MSTVVLDANVLASGFVRANPNAAPTRLVDSWEAGAYTLIVSDHIQTEVANTFQDRYFQQRMSPEQIARAEALLQYQAVVVPITVEVHGVATHPEDDLVLATAVSAQVEYLVTGDTQLQKLGSYQGVTILSPRAFLDLLEAQEQERDP
jgi:putative PIN family toxin of toxin-antitoxin system